MRRPSDGGPQGAEAKLRAANEKEAAMAAAEAAYRQRIGETVDWLGSAKITLQVTRLTSSLSIEFNNYNLTTLILAVRACAWAVLITKCL